MFIQSGKCNLNGVIQSRGEKIKVKIVKLIESSWFGDFQVLLDLESPFELKAAECSYTDPESRKDAKPEFRNYVHILSLQGNKLLELCQ